jgi:hypothetical protein
MNPTREPSAVVAAWLEEGPNELPESTRRAIAVDVRTTHQARRSTRFPWRFRSADRLSLLAMAAVAVMVLAVAGLGLPRLPPDGSNVGGHPPASTASPSPSRLEAASAVPSTPTTFVIPVMSEPFVSRRYGYSMLHPADWTGAEASQTWSAPDWKAANSPLEPFDIISRENQPPWLRAASAPLPDGLSSVNDWIDEFLTFGDPNCAPPRGTQELISIDGAPGRLRDGCGEVEATIVLEGRVYMFTLFLASDRVTNGRELFDAFAATIDLRPEDAVLPSPRP